MNTTFSKPGKENSDTIEIKRDPIIIALIIGAFVATVRRLVHPQYKSKESS